MKIPKCISRIFCIGIVILLFPSCSEKKINGSRQEQLLKSYYQEQYRPQFHFSPESGWMNDPNGLVYYAGEYHLFFQHYPDSTVWGPMHWGHAVSRDLLHWKHLPIALYPDSSGYIFSGSAVVDSANTSGLGSAGKPPLVAIFTYHNPVLEKTGSVLFQNQGLAYSNDNGNTWKKYSGNPVIKNPGIRDFRDPKMFWNSRVKKWNLIMAVYDRVYIYSSANIRDWKFESEFGTGSGAHGGVWECPDLFPLKVEGGNLIKWVMLVSINPGGPNGGSATQYFTGDFDGHNFIPDDKKEKWIDWGPDNYAGVTYSDIPAADGRRIFLGWMSNWAYATVVPSSVWRSAMTIPRELALKSSGTGLSVTSEPVRETAGLRILSDTLSLNEQKIKGDKEIPSGKIPLMQSELLLEFNMADSKADTSGIIMENNIHDKLIIGYSNPEKKVFIDRRKAGESDFSKNFSAVSSAPYQAGKLLKFHILTDAASVEVFVDDGSLVMTSLVFPKEKYSSLRLFSRGGESSLNKAMFYGLERIWP